MPTPRRTANTGRAPGRAVHSLVMFTLGTGVGGGIVLGSDASRRGRVLQGEHSNAAELGHMIVQAQGRTCGCGRQGCLEAYGSATAVVKRTLEALALDKGQSSLHLQQRGQEELTARQVFDAAAAGDALAGRVVEDTAFFLAVGAVNLMHSVDPDVVVFGGGMIAAGPVFSNAFVIMSASSLFRSLPSERASAMPNWVPTPASSALPAADDC